jgi:hypothetical protein
VHNEATRRWHALASEFHGREQDSAVHLRAGEALMSVFKPAQQLDAAVATTMETGLFEIQADRFHPTRR